MTRARALALAAYAILVGSLPTGLYDPFTHGDDDSWLLAVAAVPSALAAAEQIDRADAEKLSPAEQRRLPIGESLGNLCPGASTSKGLAERLRREAENLIAELERGPDALVTYAETDPEGERCAPDLQRRLRAALA